MNDADKKVAGGKTDNNGIATVDGNSYNSAAISYITNSLRAFSSTLSKEQTAANNIGHHECLLRFHNVRKQSSTRGCHIRRFCDSRCAEVVIDWFKAMFSNAETFAKQYGDMIKKKAQKVKDFHYTGFKTISSTLFASKSLISDLEESPSWYSSISSGGRRLR